MEILLDDPPLWLAPNLLAADEADRLLDHLERSLAWERPSLRLYGREHPIPRRQVWMGDPEASYRYSGRRFAPAPWDPAVEGLGERLEVRLAECGLPAPAFNSVLLNRYASGEERMGWHSDDEPELGPAPVIAAVSLGAERPLRFRWRHREAAPFNVWLPHGSLLVMGPGVQARLQHALLPRRLPGRRISLTFRRVLSSPSPRR
ncbi:MAG: alpha-ketoglutarate-dependent dioxygenase AlkB family protein [Halomonas sp.]